VPGHQLPEGVAILVLGGTGPQLLIAEGAQSVVTLHYVRQDASSSR
jgi:hypothetical protein